MNYPKTTLLVAALLLISAFLSAQAGLPALLLEGTGSFSVTTQSGDEIHARPGTSLVQGCTLSVAEHGRVVVLLNDQFQVFDKADDYVLSDGDQEVAVMNLNFDPVFAEYLKASMATVDGHIGNGTWKVELDASLGDGWGASGVGADKGWGRARVSAVKGWGPSGVGTDKGWGASGVGAVKGWGASGVGTDKGWGASGVGTDKGWGKAKSITDKGWGASGVGADKGWGASGVGADKGWGKSKVSTDKGWGIINRYDEKSGWGAIYRLTNSGWGASGVGTDKGWGKADPIKAQGWGASGVGTDKGWGASGVGTDKGWGKSKVSTDKGWGEEDMSIELNQPGGFYPPNQMLLSWSSVDSSERYLFVTYDLDNNVVHKAIADGASLTVPFGNMPYDKSLYYQVYAEGLRAISPPTFFKVLPPEEYTMSQGSYVNSDIYDSSPAYIQDLMRAVSFEDNERFVDCSRLYQAMLINYPGNKLVQYCYAGFLNRAGLDASIEALLTAY